MATVITNTARDFKDLDLNFNVHPVKKDITKHTGEMAVINSVKNLILTNHYERPFQPELGSNIRRMLFENLDTVTAASIEREITQTILNFEPRVRLQSVEVLAYPEKNGYQATIEFFIGNNTQVSQVSLFLERNR